LFAAAVGTPARSLETVLEPLDEMNERACARTADTVHCHFKLTSSSFGAHRQGLRITFLLDENDQIRDVTIARTTVLFGNEL
jgi:hypothetical protein